MRNKSSLILIGCGMHYQEKYHDLLERNQIEISWVIDCEIGKEKVLSFFENKTLKPKNFFFLSDVERIHFNEKIVEKIFSYFTTLKEKTILLSTEPSNRKYYLAEAAKQGFSVFMDKPVLAFSRKRDALNLQDDFLAIQKLLENKPLDWDVSCERRAHLGYLFLFDYLKTLRTKNELSLTSIDIHFAGGVLQTKKEYLNSLCHPFHMGYGVLLHSGYHYIDLLEMFLSIKDFEAEQDDFQVFSSYPKDFLAEGENFKLEAHEELDPKAFGEVDFTLLGQLRGQGKKLNYSLQLYGTSISQRNEGVIKTKLPGRLRQERIILHFGHLLSVHVESLPFHKIDPKSYLLEDFNMTIFHHPSLKTKTPVLKMTRENLSQIYEDLPLHASLNSFARKWQLKEFINGKPTHSSFDSHQATIFRLQKIYSYLYQKQMRSQESILVNR